LDVDASIRSERRGILHISNKKSNNLRLALALTLLVTGFCTTNYTDAAITTNDFAAGTDLLNGSLDFHVTPTLSQITNGKAPQKQTIG
jgi:hypothetical protein